MGYMGPSCHLFTFAPPKLFSKNTRIMRKWHIKEYICFRQQKKFLEVFPEPESCSGCENDMFLLDNKPEVDPALREKVRVYVHHK